MDLKQKLFTQQQQQGGPKYSAKTRIGNWYQDVELDDHKNKEYLYHKQNLSLASHKVKSKVSQSLKPVPISYCKDEMLHYGDHIMLVNKKTGGSLALDTSDKIISTDQAYAVTSSVASSQPQPVARSVYIVQSADADPSKKEGSPVSFGDKIRITSNAHAYRKALYLHSCQHSPIAQARFSHFQEVSMTTVKNFNTVWEIQTTAPADRLKSRGYTLSVRDPILLKHCSTCELLSSDNIPYKNDYGNEHQVSCKTQAVKNKGQQLKNQGIGHLTIQQTNKAINQQNQWFIVTSSQPVAQQEFKTLAQVHIDQLAEEIKSTLKKRGAYSIRGLGRVFRNMDDNGNHFLDSNDFRYGLQDYGISLTKEEVDGLMQTFDRDGNGHIDYNEFLRFIRGDMNEARRSWVHKAYDKLDVNHDGKVMLMDIAQLYDASQHPDYKSGKKTKEMIYKQFMSQWDTKVADGIVQFDEFLDYFRDVSASIDSDEYFAVMMKNSWKL